MSRLSVLELSAVASTAICADAWCESGTVRLGLGHPATSAEIAAVSLTVFPDGFGLPAGRGTARVGKAVYEMKCAGCHGLHGDGSTNFPALAGGRGTLATSSPLITVGSYWPYATTLWDYTRRAMPYPQPGSLTVPEVYQVSAYILHLSDIVSVDFVLDEKTLPQVRMPNRNGFVSNPSISTGVSKK